MCRKMYDRHREGLLIMYQIDFNKPEHVHFIGIGGISMSGLAEILLDEGFSVSGSDSHETALTEHLETKGARVYYGQRAANIEREPGISVVVYTAAIPQRPLRQRSLAPVPPLAPNLIPAATALTQEARTTARARLKAVRTRAAQASKAGSGI